jgi:hypothetical protein
MILQEALAILLAAMLWMQWGVVALSLLAAAFWLRSATIPIPTKYVLTGSFLVPDEPGKEQRVDPVVLAIRKQSRWSAWGAFCAAMAAILQAVVLSGTLLS